MTVKSRNKKRERSVASSSGAAAMADHSRLGRGLASLIGDVGEENATAEQARKPRRAPIENLRANPRNPRRAFGDAALAELTESIRERGIIQPIVVVEATDAQALEFAIIENVQRADLNPIEEAGGYQALMTEFEHSQEDVAQIVGKSRSHVANTLRLLALSEPVRALVQAGRLSAGHARMLVGQPNALELAQDIIARGLNVRQVEQMARKDGRAQAREVAGETKGKPADTKVLERRLSDALGLEVTVDHRGEGGTLHIKYRDLEQLDGVLRKLDRK